MGLATRGKTGGLTGMGPGMARQDAAGQVFGRVWNRTELFKWSEYQTAGGLPVPIANTNWDWNGCSRTLRNILLTCLSHDIDLLLMLTITVQRASHIF